MLISQAEKLNAKIGLSSAAIQIMMARSYWYRTSGKREEGKKIILAMIDRLKDGSDDATLGKGYYELSLYYDYDFKPNTIETHAIPVGLILNEVIVNSIKYAFDQNDNGIITVSFGFADERNLWLMVSDNGRGLPDKFDAYEGRSLGMSLITELAKQLEGSIAFLNEGGAKMILIFPYDKIAVDTKAPDPVGEYAG